MTEENTWIWIDVKDRLPETAGLVVVAANGFIALAEWSAESGFVPTTREDRVIGLTWRITHWLPIPTPPPVVTTLSDRDRDIFLKLFESDDEPNEALKDAAKAHKSLIQ